LGCCAEEEEEKTYLFLGQSNWLAPLSSLHHFVYSTMRHDYRRGLGTTKILGGGGGGVTENKKNIKS
jgi:hypothetical protein